MSIDPAADGYPLDPPAAYPVEEIVAAWARELPGVRTGSIGIVTLLWRVAKVLADDRRRTLAHLGLDPSTFDLLSVLRRAGPPYALTTRELTRRTLVTAGAISQRTARAELAGLVERSASVESRRAVVVRLTDEGHRVIGSAVRELLEHEASLVDALDPDARSTLATMLATLERALRPPAR